MAADSALVTALREQCTCVVCQDVMVPPWYLCRAGHLYCGRCIDQIVVCSVCRKLLPETTDETTRARPLEETAAAARLDVSCPNAGCTFRGTAGTPETSAHVGTCPQRLVRCLYHEFCNWNRGTLHALLTEHWSLVATQNPLSIVPLIPPAALLDLSAGRWTGKMAYPTDLDEPRDWYFRLHTPDESLLLFVVLSANNRYRMPADNDSGGDDDDDDEEDEEDTLGTDFFAWTAGVLVAERAASTGTYQPWRPRPGHPMGTVPRVAVRIQRRTMELWTYDWNTTHPERTFDWFGSGIPAQNHIQILSKHYSEPLHVFVTWEVLPLADAALPTAAVPLVSKRARDAAAVSPEPAGKRARRSVRTRQ